MMLAIEIANIERVGKFTSFFITNWNLL
jgi:hypothetical protein